MLLKSRSALYNDHPYCFLLDLLISYQQEIIKGSIIDMNNRFNKVFSSFDLHNKEFSSSSQITNIFPSQFSFYSFNKHSKDNFISHSYQLDDLLIMSSTDLSYALIVTDTSIKNNMATSITYIHIHNKSVIKTLYHTVNVMITEAELFTIRCGIN